MNETKNILIKIILTIPALLLGIFGAIMYILKPTIELWSKKDTENAPNK